jgi:hypothetical protein
MFSVLIWTDSCHLLNPSFVAASAGFIYITKVVKSSEVAVASACLQFWSIFGGTCGTAFSTLVYTNVGKLDISLLGFTDVQVYKDNLLRGLKGAFWLWASLSFLGKLDP